MGVGFSSERMTVATTSVREDMAVALVQAFGALLRPDPAGGRPAVHEAADRLRGGARARTGAATGSRSCWARRSSASTSATMSAACLGLDVDAPGAWVHHVVVRRGRARAALVLRDARDHRACAAPRPPIPALARDLLGVERRRTRAADDLQLQPAAHVHRGRGPGSRPATAT